MKTPRELNSGMFDAPIPGQSLTVKLGSRPWQKPPKLVTIEEVMDFYLDKFENEDFIQAVVESMKLEIPLTATAQIMQLSGVMNGIHTADTGTLVTPVIIEAMRLVGDSAGIDYIVGTEKPVRKQNDAAVEKAIANMDKEFEERGIDIEEFEEQEQLQEEEVEAEAPTQRGLMQRPTDEQVPVEEPMPEDQMLGEEQISEEEQPVAQGEM